MGKRVLIIPGIGDRVGAYERAKGNWERAGFEVHIVGFGWDGSEQELRARQDLFRDRFDQIDDSDDPTYVVGCSAGSIAALWLLQQRPHIRGVCLVASPFNAPADAVPRRLANRLRILRALMHELRNFVEEADAETCEKITSFYGLDPLVRPSWSRHEKITSRRLPMLLHSPTIGAALTIFASWLRRALRA